MSNINNSVNIKVTAHGAKEVTKDLKSIADAASTAAKSVEKLVHELFEINKTRSVFSGLNQDTKTLSQNLQHSRREMGLAAQSMGKVSKESSTLGKSAKVAGKNVSVLSASLKRIVGLGLGIAAIRKVAGEVMSYSKSISSLSIAFETNAGAAGRSFSELSEQAKSFGNATGRSLSSMKSLQAQLLSFRNVSGDTFDKALKGSLDISQKFGVDASSAARALGKALDSPGKSLERLTSLGVKFTDSEKEVLKSMNAVGKGAEAQALILDRLSKSVGDSSEAGGMGLAGAFNKLKNSIIGAGDAVVNFFQADSIVIQAEAAERAVAAIGKQLDALGEDDNMGADSMVNHLVDQLDLANEKALSLRKTAAGISGDSSLSASLENDLKVLRESSKVLSERDRLLDENKKKEADVLAIKGKQLEASKKLNEGTKELIDSLGLMNDKSKKFLQTMVSVGKILGGLGATDAGNMFGSIGKLFGFVKGGAFGKGGVQYMAKGGILNSPTAFGTSSGMAVAGEAGPEAVLPLSRGPGGKLGVEGSAANVNVQVIDQRSSGAAVSVEQDSGGVKITIRDEVKKMFSTGQMDGVMSQQFALSRQGSY